jgi:hypothetical protein
LPIFLNGENVNAALPKTVRNRIVHVLVHVICETHWAGPSGSKAAVHPAQHGTPAHYAGTLTTFNG